MNHQDTKTPREPGADRAAGETLTIHSHRQPHAPIPEELNRIAHQVVNAAFVVHSTLGPGLLESVYETCLAYELEKRGLSVKRQVDVPVRYGEVTLDAALRIDPSG